MTPMTTKPNWAAMSPIEKRQNEVRLRFTYRCPECGDTWTGSASDDYCCGVWAEDVPDTEEDEE